MDQSIPNDEETHIVNIIRDILSTVQQHGFMYAPVQLGDHTLTVIGTHAGEGEGEGNIIPLFLLPSAEIMLEMTDPETGEAMFRMEGTN